MRLVSLMRWSCDIGTRLEKFRGQRFVVFVHDDPELVGAAGGPQHFAAVLVGYLKFQKCAPKTDAAREPVSGLVRHRDIRDEFAVARRDGCNGDCGGGVARLRSGEHTSEL